MAENRRGKDKRFYFSRGQLVLLGGTFTFASIVIFFLGVVVGKGIEERRMVKNEEPSIKIPVKPSTQGSNGATGRAHFLRYLDEVARGTAGCGSETDGGQAAREGC